MNIKDFEYFYALSKLESYTAVAHQYQMTQPSISYAIKRLEDYYNCQLVVNDPSHRRFALTQQGEILLSHIKRLLPEIQAAKKEIDRSLSHYSTIGFPPIIMNYLLELENTDTSHPKLFQAIRPIRDGSLELLDLLFKGDLDASLLGTIEPLNHDNLDFHHLFNSEMFILMSKQHPLSAKSLVSFSELKDESFILLDEHFVHLKAFQKLNQKYHNQADVLFKTDDITLLKQMVRKNMGISLLADISLIDPHSDLVKVPLAKKDRIDFYVYFVYLKSSLLNQDVTAFLNYIEKILLKSKE